MPEALNAEITEFVDNVLGGTNFERLQISQRDQILFLYMRQGKDLLGTFIADLVLQILSFVAQNEREYIRKRQAEGIATAKARGVKFGRKPMPVPDNFYEVHRTWRSRKMTLKQAAVACNMPVGTFYGTAVKVEATSINKLCR